MGAKLKLDLHTHCFEILGFRRPSVELVGRIVTKIKERGLDGIAVTEHDNKDYGFQIQQIVEQFFNNEVLIIPGQEISGEFIEIVELYLPGNLTFRFLAHPGYPSSKWDGCLDDVQGIEIKNWNHPDINPTEVRKQAQQHNLLLLSNSDAHRLEKLGLYYNEIEIEELYSRAKSK